MIQNESRYPFGGNVYYYVTMQITFLTRKFRNVERNLHCDVVHVTTEWVPSLTLDGNGVFAIKAYGVCLFILSLFLVPSDIEKKATLDQVFRDELTRLIVNQVRQFISCYKIVCHLCYFGILYVRKYIILLLLTFISSILRMGTPW